jgi:hypothetical protein
MIRHALGLAAAVLVVGCYEPTAPAPPDLLLTGRWADAPVTPGGGGLFLTLRAAGGTITGTGQEYHLCCLYDSFTLSGDYSDSSRTFELFVRYSKGPTGTYVGRVFGADSLSGTWSGGAPTWPWHTLRRVFEPPCADSAPLLGTYDPAAPGFIVRFQDSVNAAAEAARLGALYGFTPTFVYTAAIRGFAADLSFATVAVLRCEPKVMHISYDAVVTVGATTPRP